MTEITEMTESGKVTRVQSAALSARSAGDGRRAMPKLRCPHCGGRVADVAGKRIRNESELVPFSVDMAAAYLLECPHCHRTVGLRIRSLYGACVSFPAGNR